MLDRFLLFGFFRIIGLEGFPQDGGTDVCRGGKVQRHPQEADFHEQFRQDKPQAQGQQMDGCNADRPGKMGKAEDQGISEHRRYIVAELADPGKHPAENKYSQNHNGKKHNEQIPHRTLHIPECIEVQYTRHTDKQPQQPQSGALPEVFSKGPEIALQNPALPLAQDTEANTVKGCGGSADGEHRKTGQQKHNIQHYQICKSTDYLHEFRVVGEEGKHAVQSFREQVC